MGRVIAPQPSSRRSAGQPVLALAMIVKDEAAMLARCLASARDLVDEIIVVDTGSSDGTVAIAESFGAKIGRFEWRNDFAAARNAALDLVTAPWVLHLDADEELESSVDLRARLGRLPSTTWAVEVPVVSLEDPQVRRRDQASFQKRLFRHAPHIRFERPIHEEIVNPRGGVRSRWLELTVWHYGYADEAVRRAKVERRNRPILEAAYRADPGNPVYALQLAILQPDATSALSYYERVKERADKTTLRSELFHMATVRVIERLRESGRIIDALKLATDAFVDDPTPDIAVLFGQTLIMCGELERAQAILKLGLTLPADSSSRFVTGSSSWLPLLALGEIARRNGRFGDAASWVKKAVALHPEPDAILPRMAVFQCLAGAWPNGIAALGRADITDRTAALEAAVDAAFAQGDHDAAYDGLMALKSQRTAARDAILAARILDAVGERPQAVRLLLEHRDTFPESTDLWLLLAEFANTTTERQLGVEAARRATELDAASTAAWLALSDRQATAGLHAEAAGSARKALELAPGNARGLVLLTRSLMEGGDLQAAYDTAYPLVADGTATPELVITLASLLERAGEVDEALVLLSQALDREEHPDYYATLGHILGRSGRFEDALNAFELALRHGAKPAVLADAMKFVTQAARKAGIELVSPVRAVFQE